MQFKKKSCKLYSFNENAYCDKLLLNSNLIKLFILLLLSFFIMNLENSYYIIIHRSYLKRKDLQLILSFSVNVPKINL